eukprot:3082083-Prymnesium_polylepis.1
MEQLERQCGVLQARVGRAVELLHEVLGASLDDADMHATAAAISEATDIEMQRHGSARCVQDAVSLAELAPLLEAAK